MFNPKFTITNKINNSLLEIERARGFLEAAKLNERQQKILLHLLSKKQASVGEIRQGFDLVRRTVQRDLLKLVDLDLIKEIAKSKTDPTRHYELL